MKARKRRGQSGKDRLADLAEPLRRVGGLLDIGREQLAKAQTDLGIASASIAELVEKVRRRNADS